MTNSTINSKIHFTPVHPSDNRVLLIEDIVNKNLSGYDSLSTMYEHVTLIRKLTKYNSGMFTIPFTSLIPFLERKLNIKKEDRVIFN